MPVKNLIIILLCCLSLVSMTAQEVLCFEAEDTAMLEKPMTVQKANDKNIAKGHFIELKQGAGAGNKTGGKAVYKINLKNKGKFYLWARVWWLDSCGNSFSVSVDNGPSFTFGNDNTYQRWHWVKSRIKLDLEKGPHTLTVSNREDGIKIDQFLLTVDKKMVPVDIEKSVKISP